MDCSMPGFPVLHRLPELAQIHAYWVGDAIQPSHPLLSLLLLPSIFPSIGSSPVSQIFPSGGQSIRASASASVLPVNIQGWFPLGWAGLISFTVFIMSHDWIGLEFQVRVTWIMPLLDFTQVALRSLWAVQGQVLWLRLSMAASLGDLTPGWGWWKDWAELRQSTRVPRGLLLHSQTSYREARSSQSVPRNLKWVQAVS